MTNISSCSEAGEIVHDETVHDETARVMTVRVKTVPAEIARIENGMQLAGLIVVIALLKHRQHGFKVVEQHGHRWAS